MSSSVYTDLRRYSRFSLDDLDSDEEEEVRVATTVRNPSRPNSADDVQHIADRAATFGADLIVNNRSMPMICL